jgi:SpoVK/Ycf46/Vps4 family AAA+-type ATPase
LHTAYENNIEYILDELTLLDYKLGNAVSQFKNEAKKDHFSEHSGLYISDNEMVLALERRLSADFSLSTNPQIKDAITLKSKEIETKKTMSLEKGTRLELPLFSHNLKLSKFETTILLICLAPEIDSKYEKIYAYLHNDVTKKRPTTELILNLLCCSIKEKIENRKYFGMSSNLFRYGILSIDMSPTQMGLLHYLTSPIKLDDHVTNFLLSSDDFNSRAQGFATVLKPSDTSEGLAELISDNSNRSGRMLDMYELLETRVLSIITGELTHGNQSVSNKRAPVFYFKGQSGIGKKRVAIRISKMLSKPIVVANVDKAEQHGNPREFIRLAFQEALLNSAIIYLDGFDKLASHKDYRKDEESKSGHSDGTDLQESAIIGCLERFDNVIAIVAEIRPSTLGSKISNFNPYLIEFPVPSYETRRRFWELFSKQYWLADDIKIEELAERFRFTPGQIKNALAGAHRNSSHREMENMQKISPVISAENANTLDNGVGSIVTISSADLYKSCREQSNDRLTTLAHKIEPKFGFDDIVLPPDQKAQLREIISYVKHRNAVYDKWGFERKLSLGKGLNILFAGESGTGKTMAAEIIANELNLDIYKIDLSSIVSKYIGETEKNIDKIFRESETSNSIIFFDEADAIFGKRSEVRDAHDRYANIEINYLLQKLEEHKDIVILASNLAKEIDKAFVRRVQFWIEFPVPSEDDRFKIWKNIFPKEIPLSSDIDFRLLAKQFQVSGGIIKNAAVASAFKAKEMDSECIAIKHIVLAIKREFEKIGLPLLPVEFGKYHDLIL